MNCLCKVKLVDHKQIYVDVNVFSINTITSIVIMKIMIDVVSGYEYKYNNDIGNNNV